MKALVTGAAGFIGTHLVKALRAQGHDVECVDPRLTRQSVDDDPARNYPGSVQEYLCAHYHAGLNGLTHIFHLGGYAGVQQSWPHQKFGGYTENNIVATHRLLEACMRQTPVPRVVYASSSSVIGNGDGPISPYGVSKKAGEDLMRVYALRGVHAVSLRYFTVYGPGQRPDMAFRKWIDAALTDQPLTIYGNGRQTRSFTFVDDVIDATIRAATADVPSGAVFDVGGPEPHSLLDALGILSNLTIQPNLRLDFQPAQPGDPRSVIPNLDLAREHLGYWPTTHLERGLEQQVTWQKGL